MKKETLYCDRCKKEIKVNYWDNHGFHLHKFHIEILHPVHKYMDMCPDCYNSLAEWVKNDNTKPEREKGAHEYMYYDDGLHCKIYRCLKCNINHKETDKFCPNCGIDLRDADIIGMYNMFNNAGAP